MPWEDGWHLPTITDRLEMIADRLDKLEIQVRGLLMSQTVEAKEFVVRDDHGEIRARLEMQEYSPCSLFMTEPGRSG